MLTTPLATEAATRANFASFDVPFWVWVAFSVLVVVLLLADLLLVHRTAHVVSMREALVESAVWIGLALAFGLAVLWWQGGQAAGEYYTGYIIEKALSIDNVFVWAVILSYFRVPSKYQFRVLFWGVFGALVLRAIFVFAGVALLERFEWLLFVFGAFLLFTAFKLAQGSEHASDPADSRMLKFVRRFVPMTESFDGQKMFTMVDGVRMATPLFTVLIVIEATDLVFAVDSVPAILSVSREPFIVLSSNAFAILGLRALYFALAGLKDRFRYLDYGLAGILAFVGLKMIVVQWYHLPIPVSLGIIGLLLTVSIVASLRAERREETADVIPGGVDDLPVDPEPAGTGPEDG